MNEEIIVNLKKLTFLAGLSEENLNKLAEFAEKRRLFKNELLFEEGDRVGALFLVSEGKIKLFKSSSEGRELIIRIIGSGEICGCESLFKDGRYLMSAVAEEGAEVIVLSAERFKEVFVSELGPAGLNLLESLSNCIRQLVGLIDDLAFKDVEMRILNKLYELTNEPQMTDTVNIQLTHQDIASMVGTVREVVSRTMSRLKRKGVVVNSTVRGFRVDKQRLEQLLLQRYSYIKVG